MRSADLCYDAARMTPESRQSSRALANHEISRSLTAAHFLWVLQTSFLTFPGQSRVPTMHWSNFAPKSNINKRFDSCQREDHIEKFSIYLVLWPSRGINKVPRSHARWFRFDLTPISRSNQGMSSF